MPDADSFTAEGMEKYQRGDAQAAITAFEQAVQIDPELGQAWFGMGCAHAELEQHEQAITAYEQSARFAGDQVGLPLFNMGNCYQELGRLAEAADAFRRAATADPNLADAWVNLGRILDDVGQHQGAIDCYDKAIEVTPEDPMAWSNRGNSFRGLKQFGKALESYRKALSLDPEDFASRLGSGACLVETDRAEEGLETLKKTLEDTQHPLAMFELGTALARLGLHEGAITMYDTLLEHQFETAEIWNNRGECLASLGKVDDAIISFDGAIKFDEEFAPAHFGKARLLVNAERIDEAKPVVARFLELAGEDEHSDPSVQALLKACGV